LLSVHKTTLASANAAVDRNYTVAYGAAAVGSRERLNTVVYNFFALPPVIKHFCPVAVTVGAKMLVMPSTQLLIEAPALLAELEKPFQDFYAAYADYLRRLAEWQSRFGATVTLRLSPTPLPPPPIPPGEAPAGWKPGMPVPSSMTPAPALPTTAPRTTPPATGAMVQPVPSDSAPATAAPPRPAPAAPASGAMVQPTAPVAGPPLSGPPAPARTLPGNSAPKLVVQPLPNDD
jgi:hypothetical protein